LHRAQRLRCEALLPARRKIPLLARRRRHPTLQIGPHLARIEGSGIVSRLLPLMDRDLRHRLVTRDLSQRRGLIPEWIVPGPPAPVRRIIIVPERRIGPPAALKRGLSVGVAVGDDEIIAPRGERQLRGAVEQIGFDRRAVGERIPAERDPIAVVFDLLLGIAVTVGRGRLVRRGGSAGAERERSRKQ
jgi:hypothetical protein